MYDTWNTLTVKSAHLLPAEGEEVFVCIAENPCGPFTAVRRMRTDQKALLDILRLHPSWHILWQQLPATPHPPSQSLEG